MKKVLSLFIVLLFILAGCGDSSAKTSGDIVRESSNSISSVMYVGEQNEIELNIGASENYSISASTKNLDEKVQYSLEYTSLVRPMLKVKALKAGDEEILVKSVGSDGSKSDLTVDLLIVNTNDTDKITGNPIDTNDSDGNGGDGGDGDGGDGGDPTTPPDVGGDQITFDELACVNTEDFRTAVDTWSSVEGAYGENRGGYIRSIILGNVDTQVTLYYPNMQYSDPINYHTLGRYSYMTKDNVQIIFDVQLADDVLGVVEHFYVKSNNYCLRMEIPSSKLIPINKEVTWVGGKS